MSQLPSANDILLANLKQPEAPATPSPETSPETPATPEVKAEVQTPVTPEVPTTKFDDWDQTQPATPTVPTESFNFESFVKDLGIEAKDPKELKEKLKPQPPVDVFEGVDEKLKKAVEFAKKGGDYLTYLGIQKVDYSKINPTQLYEQSVLSNPNFSPEEAKELLDSLSPLQKKERGIQLQTEYTRWQQNQIEQYESSLKAAEQSKAERKVKADQELKSTLDKVDKIAGLTLKPHHKQDIYDAITTGRMQRELFYNQKSGDYDYQSMIETYFVKKNLDKILNHVAKITSSDTLRAHMKETQNVNLDKSKEAPAPVVEQKPDALMDFIGKSRGLKK